MYSCLKENTSDTKNLWSLNTKFVIKKISVQQKY